MLPCISKTAFSTVFADKIASLSSHSNAKQNEVSQSRRCLPPPASRRGPGADPEVEADGELDLEKRASAQTCKIVNVDTYVNCRYDAKLDAGAIFGFPKGEKLTFACWKHGDCYNGVW